MLDNFDTVRQYVPDSFDEDTFVYTELLDRTKRKGNNGVRLTKTFFHRDKAEFDKQKADIINLCNLSGSRAMTRLAPRSFKKVGKVFVRLVVETAMTENWQGMKTLNRALGIVTPNVKLWLIDCDNAVEYGKAREWCDSNKDITVSAHIRSKTGMHIIVVPFDIRKWPYSEIQIHKDNPTNLYIPEGAA